MTSEISKTKVQFAIISYGLSKTDIISLAALADPLVYDLKASIHYCPLTENAEYLLVKGSEGRFIP